MPLKGRDGYESVASVGIHSLALEGMYRCFWQQFDPLFEVERCVADERPRVEPVF